MLNYGEPDAQGIDQITLDEAEKYMQEGHFGGGSKKPKVKACIHFLKSDGKKVIITSIDKARNTFEGNAGTAVQNQKIIRGNLLCDHE